MSDLALRRETIKRLGHKCQRCNDTSSVELCHIRSRQFGGSDTPENLSILCGPCHTDWHVAEKRGWPGFETWLRYLPEPFDQWTFTGEAAAVLKVNRSRVRQLIQEGRIPAVRVGSLHAIRRDHLEAAARTLKEAGSKPGRRGRRPNISKTPDDPTRLRALEHRRPQEERRETP